MYTKSEFLAELLGELRAPTISILGFSKILTDGQDGALNQQQASDILVIQKSGEHLQRLINLTHEILYVDNKFKNFPSDDFSWEIINLSQTINDTFLHMEKNSHFLYENVPTEIDFVKEIPEDLPPIQADKMELIHIISSLIMASAGSVSSCSKIFIKIVFDNKWLDLSVMANSKEHFSKFDELQPKYSFTNIYESIAQERQECVLNATSLAVSYGLIHLYGAELRTKVTETSSVIALRLLRK